MAAQSYPAFPAELNGGRVVLRRATEADVPRFAQIVAEPEVAAWWPRQDADRLRGDMFGEDVATYAIELDDGVIGSVMVWEEADPDYRSASLDVFIDTAHLGQGLGGDALRTLAKWLFEVRGHHRITIDPAVANARARRAYEKVGFKPVGVMRRYECSPDRQWRDGLLMDLLPDELRGA